MNGAYMVLTADTVEELSQNVTKAMQEGWSPVGGVAIGAWSLSGGTGADIDVQYAQAIVRVPSSLR